jgi:23S rRNA (uridine2552-2'-O)-methyltransferase
MGAYQRKDAVYRRAKQEGLASRAAIKLEDLDRKFRLFASGQRVLDLGSWPGGWLQIASRRVGPSGRVVGIDLKQINSLGLTNVITLRGDVSDTDVMAEAVGALGGVVDLVLCDLAPQLTGVTVSDQARHSQLASLAIEIAAGCLGREGKMLLKLFSSCERDVSALLKKNFDTVTKFRPGSTRKGSSELYALATRPSSSAADS